MGRYKAYVKRSFYSNIKSWTASLGPKWSNIHLNMFLDFFPPRINTLSDIFVVTHQTVQLSIGGAKNIFDFEYDFECANMPLLLQNVTTCLHVSVVYALKHFERTYNILLRTSGGHAC